MFVTCLSACRVLWEWIAAALSIRWRPEASRFLGHRQEASGPPQDVAVSWSPSGKGRRRGGDGRGRGGERKRNWQVWMGQESGGWGLLLADGDIGEVCYTDKRAPSLSFSLPPSCKSWFAAVGSCNEFKRRKSEKERCITCARTCPVCTFLLWLHAALNKGRYMTETQHQSFNDEHLSRYL